MVRFAAVVLLFGMTHGVSAQNPTSTPMSAPTVSQNVGGSAAAPTEKLPPPPPGKSTILGGEIRSVDPVRDELLLKAYGQRPIKILFDERTEVYRDGKRIPLLSLHTSDHASIETILDGTNIFARSIHILSRTPEGDYQGKVVSYDPTTTELVLTSVLSRQPLKLLVPGDTPIVREGQKSFTSQRPGASDLVHGALVSLKFESDNKGRGVATRISILAVPGAQFVFIGNVTALDLHSGHLVVTDPRDDKTYDITFSSRLTTSQNLHQADHVMVKATFDGDAYVASSISIE